MRADVLQPINTARGNSLALDLNQTSNALIFHVGQYSTCSVQFNTDESTAVLTLYKSNDGRTERTLTELVDPILGPGSDMSETIDCTGFLYLHVQVTTLAGASAFGQVHVIGKTYGSIPASSRFTPHYLLDGA